MKIPSPQHFQRASNHRSLLLSLLRSHQIFDAMLVYLIVETIEVSDPKEIERVSFVLKVDLAIGLKMLPASVRPLFVRLNRIRNKLAHNFFAKITKADSANLHTIVPTEWWTKFKNLYPDTPGGELRLACLWAHCLLSIAISNHRDRRVRDKAAAPIIEKAMAMARKREAEGWKYTADLPDVEAIVAAERAARRKAGDY